MSEEGSMSLNKARVEALTEGIFATAMTLLVLGLVVPAVTGPNEYAQLETALLALWPNLLIYVISFITLGVIWIGHNQRFLYIHRVSGKLMWVNLLFLLSVGLLPFTTALIGKYPLEQLTVIVYGAHLMAITLFMNLFWLYSLRHHENEEKDGHETVLRKSKKRNYFGIFAYPLAIILSFINTEISIVIFVLVPIYYIIMGTLYGY